MQPFHILICSTLFVKTNVLFLKSVPFNVIINLTFKGCIKIQQYRRSARRKDKTGHNNRPSLDGQYTCSRPKCVTTGNWKWLGTVWRKSICFNFNLERINVYVLPFDVIHIYNIPALLCDNLWRRYDVDVSVTSEETYVDKERFC